MYFVTYKARTVYAPVFSTLEERLAASSELLCRLWELERQHELVLQRAVEAFRFRWSGVCWSGGWRIVNGRIAYRRRLSEDLVGEAHAYRPRSRCVQQHSMELRGPDRACWASAVTGPVLTAGQVGPLAGTGGVTRREDRGGPRGWWSVDWALPFRPHRHARPPFHVSLDPGNRRRQDIPASGQDAIARRGHAVLLRPSPPADREIPMKLYRPMLFVGLGGTGCQIGAEPERRLRDQIFRDEIWGPDSAEYRRLRESDDCYQLPSCPQFVYADTQGDMDLPPVVLGARHLTAHYLPDLAPRVDTYPAVARNLRLSAGDVGEGWLPPPAGEPQVAPLQRADGQLPMVGRAALFETFRGGVGPLVQDLRSAIGNLSTSGDDLYRLGGGSIKPDVFVAFSVAGGTGAGIFYDYLHPIGDVIEQTGLRAKIYPMVLMPSAFPEGVGGGRPAKLNPGRALFDLFRLIDQQNGGDADRRPRGRDERGVIAPEDIAVHYLCDGRTVPRPATMQTAFLFSRSVGAEPDDLRHSVASLMLSLIGAELNAAEAADTDARQSFAGSSFINSSIERQIPAETDIGTRAVSTALVASLTVHVDDLADVIAGWLLRAAVDELSRPLHGDLEAAATGQYLSRWGTNRVAAASPNWLIGRTLRSGLEFEAPPPARTERMLLSLVDIASFGARRTDHDRMDARPVLVEALKNAWVTAGRTCLRARRMLRDGLGLRLAATMSEIQLMMIEAHHHRPLSPTFRGLGRDNQVRLGGWSALADAESTNLIPASGAWEWAPRGWSPSSSPQCGPARYVKGVTYRRGRFDGLARSAKWRRCGALPLPQTMRAAGRHAAGWTPSRHRLGCPTRIPPHDIVDSIRLPLAAACEPIAALVSGNIGEVFIGCRSAHGSVSRAQAAGGLRQLPSGDGRALTCLGPWRPRPPRGSAATREPFAAVNARPAQEGREGYASCLEPHQAGP
jgi:hypothetical protein